MSNSLRICVVVAEYYDDIAKNLIKGASFVLDKHKTFKHDKIKPGLIELDKDFKSATILECTQVIVPGVFEIPGMIARFIDKYHAFIALGCVIKGDTPHFDFISKASINGIMNLSIKHKKPILNGIITSLNTKQALERSDPNKKNKGGEAARALIHLLGITENK